MTRTILSDEAWGVLRNILTEELNRYATPVLRRAVEGILWRLRTGSPWRDLPSEFGPWNSVYQLYNRWCKEGILDQLLEFAEGTIDYRTAYIDGTYISAHQHASGAPKGQEAAIGLSRGGRTTKIHAVCDRQGQPVLVEITAGNVNDLTQAESMVEDLTLFEEVVADKGYDSDSFRIDLIENDTRPCIPIKTNSNRENPGFHKSKYKKRHRIENLFARLKHYRAIATRYDKLKVIFEGTVKLGLIAIWLGLLV